MSLFYKLKKVNSEEYQRTVDKILPQIYKTSYIFQQDSADVSQWSWLIIKKWTLEISRIGQKFL